MTAIHKPMLCALVALAAVAAPLALAQPNPGAASPEQKPAGLDQLDCRTLLRLSGDERDFTILYLHGYVSGKRGQTLLPAQQLAQETDQAIDHCINRPDDKLLPLFDRLRGN